ncbi:MAG: bifunctional UDP-sugar hydrolase/5'-nucleotidase, partial [Elusimicrobiota bacterium]
AARAEIVRIQVFHTNDIHGWIMPRPAAFHKENPERLVGGAGALANAIKKHAEPGARTLLLDGGDWFQGTPEGTLSGGKVMVEVFNALDYDAVVVGNHDYDLDEGRLKGLIADLKVPVLGFNVVRTATGERVPYLKPYVLKDLGGVKVGIFGLLTSNMPFLNFAKNFPGLTAQEEVSSARRAVAELKAAGAEVIVALTHVGIRRDSDKEFIDDRRIAAEVPGIDLIVGGHTHTALTRPERDPAHGTLIVQAGSYLTRVGSAVLEFDTAQRKVMRSEGGLRDLWIDELGEDPALLKIVDKHRSEVGRALDVVVGTAAAALSRDRTAESALGDWLTDCERKYTKTQIAVQNSGGIRADLPAGPVTLRRLFEIMPFDNAIVTMNLRGDLVRRVLEYGASGKYSMMQVSGVRFSYDESAPPGRRVREAFVGEAPLKDDGVYSLTTADFLAQGGVELDMLPQGRDQAFTPILIRDVLAWCAQNYSPISIPPAGRITQASPRGMK